MLSGPTDGPLSLDRSFFLRLEYLRSHLFSKLKSAILAPHGADSVSRGETRSDPRSAGLRPQEMVKRPPPQMPFGGEASKVLVAPGERHRCIRDPPPLDGARAGRSGLGRRGLSPSPPLAMWDRGRAPTRVDNEGGVEMRPGRSPRRVRRAIDRRGED